ncbi:MAG: acyl-CoA carboxylase subunit beta [Bacteroidales bacterium]|nr:acyl-CoA carboxylase subunit beta [Bacteroidales bacterium]
MNALVTKIDTSSKEFTDRKIRYKDIVGTYNKNIDSVCYNSDEKSVQRHKSRGKLLARDRINLLVDPGTPFLELSALAAFNMHNNSFPSAGIITGIGVIHGIETIIVANDATVKGGTYISETIKKHLRAQEIAKQNNLPCVYMVDSGGVFLPDQAKVFPDKFDFGRIFFNQARLSAAGIPQISIVMGSCTAGGAYIPAMSDETIIVRNQGTIFLAGPPLVKAATGETVTAEELGGAIVHTEKSGVADHIAESDEHALQICRNIFESLPRTERQYVDRQMEYVEPEYPAEELYGILPVSTREQVDPREIIMRIVDGSRFHEFKTNYAPTLVTGFAHVMGYPVGIIANNGILFSESALKGTHFIELCNFRKIPILFLQNITGFMVGKTYENAGIAKDGAKMVHAVATANVPVFTFIIGGSHGAGNYAMAGRAYDPRLLFMVPAAKISVMGGEQAANVLISIKEEQLKKSGKEINEEEKIQLRDSILKKYEEEGSAYYSTARLWDDGIVDPADFRKTIAMGISISLNKKFPEPRSGVYRM